MYKFVLSVFFEIARDLRRGYEGLLDVYGRVTGEHEMALNLTFLVALYFFCEKSL